MNNLCSVKRNHFDEIFNEYFYKQPCDFNGSEGIYENVSIYKIHLKHPENIKLFLQKLFDHLITFAGEDYGTLSDEEHKYEAAKETLIKYLKSTPIEELERGRNLDERTSSSGSKYNIDKDFEELNSLRELGEFILYFLVESVLEAPLGISKIKLKTSSQMPAYGADCIHFSSDFQKVIFGESKLTNGFENSKNQARDSLEKFAKTTPINYLTQEIGVISRNICSIDMQKSGLIKTLVSPYVNKAKAVDKLPYDMVCFLGYEDKKYSDNFLKSGDKQLYEAQLAKKIENLLDYFNKKKSLKNKKITFFLLPIVDVFKMLKEYGLKLSEPTNNP